MNIMIKDTIKEEKNNMIIEQALDEIDYNIIVASSIYYNDEGIIVPRVTDILSKTIHADGLMRWANSLGFKRLVYEEELNRAAEIGTRAHNAIEHYLQDNIARLDNTCFMGFKKWYDTLCKTHTVEIVGIEQRLICKYFGGTYDLLLKIDGRIFLVDFKTSNKITVKHFLQLSAYRYMLYNTRGINIDGCIILQLNKKEIGCKEYTLDFTIDAHYIFIEECIKSYLSLVYAYYNTRHIEELFKTIKF